MAPNDLLPPKKDVALALLEQSSIFIHLDPRPESVRVPPWFKKQPQLILQIGLNMVVKIPDLHLDDEGFSCTLSFSRNPHFCQVPWKVVYAVVNEQSRGMVWPDDVPPEVASQMQSQPAPKPKALHLHSVTEENPAAKTEPRASEPPKAAKKRGKKPKLEIAGAEEKPAVAPAPLPAAAPVAASPAASDSGSSAAEQAKKRKLPPYLRVVK